MSEAEKRYNKIMETNDIILGKAKFEDWAAMYRNVWSREETARYMVWRLSESEEDAKIRILKSIEHQKNHDTYLVYSKKSGEAIGFAGVEKTAPHSYRETGIALGPEYTGRGYGKQVLRLLLENCASLGGKEFWYSCRSENSVAKGLALSMGFEYKHSEKRTDPRNGEIYRLEFYIKML